MNSSDRLEEEALTERFITGSGPGGQNVNKVATTVQLRFDLDRSRLLSAAQKRRLARLASHLMTSSGQLVIEANRFRSQARNREDARERLAALIAEACKPPPPPRKKTRPGKGAIERRLKSKRQKSAIKGLRGRVREE